MGGRDILVQVTLSSGERDASGVHSVAAPLPGLFVKSEHSLAVLLLLRTILPLLPLRHLRERGVQRT